MFDHDEGLTKTEDPLSLLSNHHVRDQVQHFCHEAPRYALAGYMVSDSFILSDVDLPIILPPMAFASTPALASEVIKAGGFAFLGAGMHFSLFICRV